MLLSMVPCDVLAHVVTFLELRMHPVLVETCMHFALAVRTWREGRRSIRADGEAMSFMLRPSWSHASYPRLNTLELTSWIHTSMLRYVLDACPLLKSVSLVRGRNAHVALIACRPLVVHLSLRGSSRITSLAPLANLLELDIAYCTNVTSIRFLQRSPFLRKLDMCGCYRVDDVEILGTFCTRLESVLLCSCHRATDDVVVALARGCTQLKYVDVSRCIHLTDFAFETLVRSCVNLQSIYTLGCVSMKSHIQLPPPYISNSFESSVVYSD